MTAKEYAAARKSIIEKAIEHSKGRPFPKDESFVWGVASVCLHRAIEYTENADEYRILRGYYFRLSQRRRDALICRIIRMIWNK